MACLLKFNTFADQLSKVYCSLKLYPNEKIYNVNCFSPALRDRRVRAGTGEVQLPGGGAECYQSVGDERRCGCSDKRASGYGYWNARLCGDTDGLYERQWFDDLGNWGGERLAG